jgi:uncharacterized protein (TIGR02598 family)
MKKISGGRPALGFSLVEVALSLAILAVGMVGVLALLPVGLESARQVHAEAVMASLVRTRLAEFATNGLTESSYAEITPPKVSTNQFFKTESFTAEGGQILNASNATLTSQPYFRLEYQLVSANPDSARYRLRLRWPEAALALNTNNPIIQNRNFVAEVLRGF